ncbi:hypothetical protein [Mucilaginibacter ginsenosidivorax]|uniref:hypothetical protein n=1 Tax=Mucilaginibacter ginsenosidivorax TaxID=862126 RepID=UPI0013155223|nr:hypothetical protein [Mucilaginibacter ginsenosidivorax]
MNCLNKLNFEWTPSAYNAMGAGNTRLVKTSTGQGPQLIKPLVRHTYSKKKISGR